MEHLDHHQVDGLVVEVVDRDFPLLLERVEAVAVVLDLQVLLDLLQVFLELTTLVVEEEEDILAELVVLADLVLLLSHIH
jgi:hypothetical protein